MVAFRGENDLYKVVGKSPVGRLVEFLCDGSATNFCYRVDVTRDQIPPTVTDALKARMPGVKATKVQACGRNPGEVITYRFVGEGLPAGSNAVYVSTTGRNVTPAAE